MNIGIYVNEFTKNEGGGYTLQDSILRNISLKRTNHQLYLISYSDEIKRYTKGTTLTPIVLKKPIHGIVHRALSRTKKILQYSVSQRSLLDQACSEYQIDIMYFTSYSYEDVDVPYVYTVWDLQHRLQPFFPEVSKKGIWEARESATSKIVQRASYIITGTDRGASEVCQFYNVHSERIKVIPFPTPEYIFESDQIHVQPSKKDENSPHYLFYPAQLWPHKNHITLFEAISKLKKEGLILKLVCTGSDKDGQYDYLIEMATKMGIKDQIEFKGMVSESELIRVYQNARLLVFPSLFGPDNLPPLEAMALGCPVLVADVPGAREQYSDSALYFDPLDVYMLAKSIREAVNDNLLRKELIKKGKRKANSLKIEGYVEALFQVFDEFSKYRKCWK